MRIRINSTIYAVTDPHHPRCHCDIHIFTIGDCAHSLNSSTENGAIATVRYVEAVYCLVNVDVAFFAIQNFDVNSSNKVGVIFDCDTLIQISNVL